jgi:hypothetical protein
VLFGVGIHHLIATGTCSSTGYSGDLGPVARCPAGTGYWFAFVFGGVFMVVIGGLVSGGSSALFIVPAVFSAIGIGALTVAFDSHAQSSTKTFGLIFGGVFAVIGLIPLMIIGIGGLKNLISASGSRSRSSGAATGLGASSSGLGTPATGLGTPATGLASSSAAAAFGGASSQPDAILGAYAASPSPSPGATPGLSQVQVSGTIGSAPRQGDVFDKISRLSDLHKSGALTDDEFNREKAKLLAEL